MMNLNINPINYMIYNLYILSIVRNIFQQFASSRRRNFRQFRISFIKGVPMVQMSYGHVKVATTISLWIDSTSIHRMENWHWEIEMEVGMIALATIVIKQSIVRWVENDNGGQYWRVTWVTSFWFIHAFHNKIGSTTWLVLNRVVLNTIDRTIYPWLYSFP